MNRKIEKIGHIKFKGIHNDFCTRDILDYTLLYSNTYTNTLGVKPISSGIIKLNNDIYTNMKFSNEIREKGGVDFLFGVNGDDKFSSDVLKLFLKNNESNLSLFTLVFCPLRVTNHSFNPSFTHNEERYTLKLDLNIHEVIPVNFVLNYIKIDRDVHKKLDNYSINMWVESEMGKISILNSNGSSLALSKMKNNLVIGGVHNDFTLKCEIFDTFDNSLIQFTKPLLKGNYEMFENYKKENSIINFSYSVST